MGAYFHDNVELKFAAAYDSDELWHQIRCRPSRLLSIVHTKKASL